MLVESWCDYFSPVLRFFSGPSGVPLTFLFFAPPVILPFFLINLNLLLGVPVFFGVLMSVFSFTFSFPFRFPFPFFNLNFSTLVSISSSLLIQFK